MRNLLRALVVAGSVVANPVFAEEVGRAGDSPPDVPENVTEMNQGYEEDLVVGGGGFEPEVFVPVVEYSGFGGDELPSRE